MKSQIWHCPNDFIELTDQCRRQMWNKSSPKKHIVPAPDRHCEEKQQSVMRVKTKADGGKGLEGLSWKWHLKGVKQVHSHGGMVDTRAEGSNCRRAWDNREQECGWRADGGPVTPGALLCTVDQVQRNSPRGHHWKILPQQPMCPYRLQNCQDPVQTTSITLSVPCASVQLTHLPVKGVEF